MSSENVDTVPFPSLPDESEPLAPAERLPEPALVRGAITSVLGLISIAVGHEINPAIVEYLLTLYVTAGPIALAWWIRRHVSPTTKPS